MSEEFRGTIAVNSLWPKIPVLVRSFIKFYKLSISVILFSTLNTGFNENLKTAASEMQAKDFKNLMRDPSIYSDAAYGLICEGWVHT